MPCCFGLRVFMRCCETHGSGFNSFFLLCYTKNMFKLKYLLRARRIGMKLLNLVKRLLFIAKNKRKKCKISILSASNSQTWLEGNNKVGRADIRSSKIGFGTYILSGQLSGAKIGRFCCLSQSAKAERVKTPR